MSATDEYVYGAVLVHKTSGNVHRKTEPGEPIVLDSWEERECSVIPRIPHDVASRMDRDTEGSPQ